MAIAREVGVVQVAGLRQIHFATLDNRLQGGLLNAKLSDPGHQGLGHRMSRLTGKSLAHFAVPPS